MKLRYLPVENSGSIIPPAKIWKQPKQRTGLMALQLCLFNISGILVPGLLFSNLIINLRSTVIAGLKNDLTDFKYELS